MQLKNKICFSNVCINVRISESRLFFSWHLFQFTCKNAIFILYCCLLVFKRNTYLSDCIGMTKMYHVKTGTDKSSNKGFCSVAETFIMAVYYSYEVIICPLLLYTCIHLKMVALKRYLYMIPYKSFHLYKIITAIYEFLECNVDRS